MGNQTHKETTANVDTLNVHQCLAALVLEVFCICMQHDVVLLDFLFLSPLTECLLSPR